MIYHVLVDKAQIAEENIPTEALAIYVMTMPIFGIKIVHCVDTDNLCTLHTEDGQPQVNQEAAKFGSEVGYPLKLHFTVKCI